MSGQGSHTKLKPNVIVRGPFFPEPIQVILIIPMGDSIKLIGKGLTTGQVHEPILSQAQIVWYGRPLGKSV